MKIKLVTTFTIAFLFTLPAYAEVKEYSDDYVSFSYNDEMPGEISIINSEENSHSIHYSFTCADNTANGNIVYDLSIIEKNEDFDQEFYDTLFEIGKVEAIKHQDDDLVLCYSTFSNNTEDPELIKYWDDFQESLTVADNLKSVDSSGIDSQNLVSNVHLSDQALVYAQAALDILNGYMSMDLDPEDASEQAEKLQERIENFLDGTGSSYYDYKIRFPLYNMDYYLKYGHDDIVSESIQELKEILAIDNQED